MSTLPPVAPAALQRPLASGNGGYLNEYAWLLTLHPALPAGKTYAAYGGIYVAAALVWLWRVDGIMPDRWDLLGVAVALLGMAIIAFAPHAR